MNIVLTANSVDLLLRAEQVLKDEGYKESDCANEHAYHPSKEDETTAILANEHGRNIWYAYLECYPIERVYQFANHDQLAQVLILLTEETFDTSMKFFIQNLKNK